MACRLTWTEGATADIEDYAHVLTQRSPAAAARSVQTIHDAAERLCDFPESGRIVPEWRHRGPREISVKHFRVIYRLEPDEVVIIGVEDARQILPGWYSADEESET
ncbi:MAG TPA: type II toxin-antitoxin system RelE/ParE family toxin [Longimicrobium sp.]|nr:type II toxin-antitoxin system RelE/ParE family toxin [Longimicrobium sp.]